MLGACVDLDRPQDSKEHTVSGFKKFLLRGNLVDLAVAFVIGAAFAALVTALVTDFITPLLGLIGGKGAFGGRTLHDPPQRLRLRIDSSTR